MAAAFRLAEAHDAVFQIHVLEDSSEEATARKATGMGVVEALDSIGALRPGTVLAHSIYLSDEDMARIAAGGAGIAHNPQSNMKLGIPKAAPVTGALAAGIPVGLGTDGPASNNNLDLFDEMNAAAKIQKFALGDPTALPAETVFRMATMGGARVLNLQDEIGSLEPGKRADIVLLDMERPGLTPLYRVYSHLVYAARGSDVGYGHCERPDRGAGSPNPHRGREGRHGAGLVVSGERGAGGGGHCGDRRPAVSGVNVPG